MTELNLLNKKILYIGPVFFHYDQAVINKMTSLGAKVDAFELYPNSFYFKTIRKLKLPNVETYKHNYYNEALNKTGYDYVLLRHGHQLDPDFLNRLRKINSSARLINFHWDSIKPDYNYVPIINYFDKVFSFDYKDCETHQLSYLPLFYLDEYVDHKKNNSDHKNEIDILFIGSWRNKERYDLIKLTDKICKQNSLNFYYFLNYSFKAQFNSLKKGIVPKEAKNKSLSHQEILNFFSNSSNIIDFPSSFQTGLTMRTFETLGAGKKLITTNKNIIYEPFYNEEYINIIDPSNFKLDMDFIKNVPVSSIEDKIENYSIKNYIYKLLQE